MDANPIETSSQSQKIHVRNIEFNLDENIGPCWNPKKPEWSHISDAIFISLPFIEPYLIRNMHKCIGILEEKSEKKHLKDEIAAFIKQESNHFKQHRKYNEALKKIGYSKIHDFERRWAEDLRHFYKHKSLKFNLAYAVGFETITYSLASMLLNDQEYWLKDADPNVSSLALWHSLEEIEHKSVAFDVYQTLAGGYFYRIYGFFYVLAHFMRISWPIWRYMLQKDGLWSSYRCRYRLFVILGKISKELIKGFSEFCHPNFHPSKSRDPKPIGYWRRFFNKKADSKTSESTPIHHKTIPISN